MDPLILQWILQSLRVPPTPLISPLLWVPKGLPLPQTEGRHRFPAPPASPPQYLEAPGLLPSACLPACLLLSPTSTW